MSLSITTAYEAIQQGILMGRLRPGDRLRERTIAAELGISRTPVREALRQLEADGFVSHRPNAGVTVSDLSERSIVELAELRSHLVALAARLAARQPGEALAGRLAPLADAIGAALEGAGEPGFDPGAAFPVIARFHAALFDGCGNTWLARAFHRTTFPMVMQATYVRMTAGEWAVVARYFQDLVTSLREHDEDHAAVLAEAYFRNAGRRLLAAYRARSATRPAASLEPAARRAAKRGA